MRTQAAAPAGHRNMQTPPRSARLARDSLRAGNQASEHRNPHQYTEVAPEPSVSSVAREWARERVRIGVIVVEGLPAIVSQIVQKHCPLQKLFDNRWLHLIVLDIRTDQFVRYESQGQ